MRRPGAGRRLAPVLALAAGLLLAAAPAGAIYLNDVDAAAVGGVQNWYDSENRFANVVALSIDGLAICTGTLINSRTVLTAGHCALSDETGVVLSWLNEVEVRFSPDSTQPTANDRALSGVAVNPAYAPAGYPYNDVALISLARPVTEIAPVTLATSPAQLPGVGDVVWMAGYGEMGTGTQNNLGYDERRRAVTGSLGEIEALPDGGYLLNLEFRDPLNPNNPNDYDLTAPVPAWQGSPAPGDSGGPLFMVMPDGALVQIGVASMAGIEDPDNPGQPIFTYGSFATYGAVADHVDWLAAANPLRSTSAAAGAFAWSDASRWTDTLGRHETPDNVDGDFAFYGTLGRYYEVTLANAAQIHLDLSPTLDRLTLAHPAARLDIAAGTQLEVLLDTALGGGSLAIGGTLVTGGLLQFGGVVSGTGTLRAASGYVQAGGTLAPGAAGALGTLTLAGDYAANDAAQLNVRLGAAGADLLDVSGTARLDGTLAYGLFDPAPFGSYTVLTAGEGIAGAFAAFAGPSSAFATVTAAIGGNEVTLAVEKARAFASAGLTANQRAVGGALDRMDADDPLVASAAWLPSLAAARGAFDRLSGQGYASLQTVLLQDSRFARQSALDRLRAASGAGAAAGAQVASFADDGTRLVEPAPGTGTDLWLQGFGAFGDLDVSPASAGLTRDIGGFHAGLDRLFFDAWRIGAFGGYSHSSIGAGALSASYGVDSYTLGLYGGRSWGPLALRLGGAYGWNEVSARRSLALPGLAETLTADISAGTSQIFGELAYGLALPAATLEPFASLAYVALEGDDFAEAGGSAALASPGLDASAGFGTLGARLSVPLGERATLDLRLDASAAWQHAWGDALPTLAVGFAGGPAFTTTGAPLARDTALLEAGLIAQAGDSVHLAVRYTGQLGDGLRDNGVEASVRVSF
ncbi:autotransporter domain-containing protein [Ancylobacter vacuolatus]|uniref:Outer membrane autotransporter protein n=1 Tax=Ancylobacter vacuolatus TaxID=223389 RepID=A0ABU0DE24_9HYPH|nr:autotransporter domain-containing protein [Ancylobacter vacuolatus]MDQ0346667.1 outer membrane autotransporter protein [Ancylobacter vacuolatus]